MLNIRQALRHTTKSAPQVRNTISRSAYRSDPARLGCLAYRSYDRIAISRSLCYAGDPYADHPIEIVSGDHYADHLTGSLSADHVPDQPITTQIRCSECRSVDQLADPPRLGNILILHVASRGKWWNVALWRTW